MRISTKTIYEMGSARISDLQVAQARTQQQLSTGRRILTPADDPVASARALEVAQSDSMNEQFATNRQNAKSSLSAVEGTLAGVTALLQDAKTLTVSAGNGILSNTERGFLATELRGQFDQLLGLANTTDGSGNYLFSGYQISSSPFSKISGGAQYQGDQGQRELQVDGARKMALSDSGSAIFENINTGANGPFVTAANTANTGTGAITASLAVPPVPLTGHNYDVTFANPPTTFDIRDLTTGQLVIPTPPSYTSGVPFTFDGLQLTITDGATAPVAGDKFTVQPAKQDIFKTLDDLIRVLETGSTTTPKAAADMAAGLATANANIDKSLDNVLMVRASVGSRLKELDSLDSVGDDRSLQYKTTLSALQDLDYAKAISDLNQQQLVLDAAQKSFVKTSGLSLFTYL